jgi:hypothetical protein
MAVFPDRIVQKSSTDDVASVKSQVAVGQPDQLVPGEIVVQRGAGTASIIVFDAANIPVEIGGGGGSGPSFSITDAEERQLLFYDSVNAQWINDYQSLGEHSDVDLTTNAPAAGQLLRWDGTDWVPVDLLLEDLSDVSDIVPTFGQALVWQGSEWAPGTVSGGGSGGSGGGRGDGGDFDSGTVDAGFEFGVWGAGDFDTTGDDKPWEVVIAGGTADGGDFG